MSFSIATYNVLANAYVRRSYYPNVTDEALDPTRRRTALLRRIDQLGADVVCLQEVESDLFADLEERLDPEVYRAEFARKKGKKRPDGCATFVRREAFEVQSTHVQFYADGVGGAANSGHVALITVLRKDERELVVANTHLKWDIPGETLLDHLGYRQLRLLLRGRKGINSSAPWIVCGDLNVVPAHEVIKLARSKGFALAHRGALAPTCVANQKARKLDYLLHTAQLAATPGPVPAVDDSTPLPSVNEPSDHLPTVAEFRWVGGPKGQWGHSAKETE